MTGITATSISRSRGTVETQAVSVESAMNMNKAPVQFGNADCLLTLKIVIELPGNAPIPNQRDATLKRIADVIVLIFTRP